mgnify:CR=1 FL=1
MSLNRRPISQVISRSCGWRAGNVGCMLQGFRGGKNIFITSCDFLKVVVCSSKLFVEILNATNKNALNVVESNECDVGL